jgi:hypothetical protein
VTNQEEDDALESPLVASRDLPAIRTSSFATSHWQLTAMLSKIA